MPKTALILGAILLVALAVVLKEVWGFGDNVKRAQETPSATK